MLEIIFICCFGLYLILIVAAIIGLNRTPYQGEYKSPHVSVIVPARNEAENIGACIKSLLKQDYPENLYEILVVNDGSEDNTAEIVRSFAERHSQVILLQSEKNSTLPPGKARALEIGISHAKGEIIFNTDADCQLGEKWLSETLKFYDKNRYSMVNGVTLPEGGGWLGGVQTLDFAFLHGVAAGFSGIGLQLAGMGNNMSYRKEPYLRTGGFAELGFSVTEDFQLTRAFLAQGAKVAHIASEKTLVKTLPSTTLAELFNQKKRWAAGGLNSPPLFYLLFFAAIFAVVGLLSAPYFLSGWLLLIPFCKIIADFLLIWLLLSKVKMRGKLRYFLLFELYLSVYVLIFPLIIPFFRAVRWKGRIFR